MHFRVATPLCRSRERQKVGGPVLATIGPRSSWNVRHLTALSGIAGLYVLLRRLSQARSGLKGRGTKPGVIICRAVLDDALHAVPGFHDQGGRWSRDTRVHRIDPTFRSIRILKH